MRYLNRWSVSCAWVVAMIVAWFTLVPNMLSASTWAVGMVAGPVLLVGAATFREAGRPTPSFRQTQAESDAADLAAGGRKRAASAYGQADRSSRAPAAEDRR